VLYNSAAAPWSSGLVPAYMPVKTLQYQVLNAGSVPIYVGSYNKIYWTKFDQCGAIFTGLNYQTTLSITWIVDIERFPNELDTDLVVLATPSPCYDPRALEAYSLIMQDMPTGVAFAENGLGDWFMEAVSRVRDVVMPGIRAVAKTNPAVGALVSVHDLVTGKKGGKGKKGKKGSKNADGGFLAPGSTAQDGKVRLARNKPKRQVWRPKVVVTATAPKAPPISQASAYHFAKGSNLKREIQSSRSKIQNKRNRRK